MNEATFVRKTVKKLNKYPDAYFYRNHGGRFGLAGLADITGVHNGRFVAIECKIITLPKRGSTIVKLLDGITPLQKHFLINIENANGMSFIGLRFEPIGKEYFFPIDVFWEGGSKIRLDMLMAQLKLWGKNYYTIDKIF